MSALFAVLHHLAAFALFAALAIELVLLKPQMTLREARTIQVADLVYGVAAGVLLLAGLHRVFLFEKGATYYFSTWTFLAKFGLFILVGLASILPTLEFLRWRAATRAGKAPEVAPETLRKLRMIVHLEALGIALIIIFAVLMARGVGLLR